MEYRKTLTLKDGRTCVLRQAEEEDAPSVLDNFLLTHGQTDFLMSYPEEISFTIEQERDFLKKEKESPREVQLVAEVEGCITGTAGIDAVGETSKTRHRAGFGIAIDKTFWGLGIGRALTEACIECARAAGFLQIELDVVSDNDKALRLYESLGFEEYGRNPLGFLAREGKRQELVLMRLELY